VTIEGGKKISGAIVKGHGSPLYFLQGLLTGGGGLPTGLSVVSRDSNTT
jgi:hypothetical protein